MKTDKLSGLFNELLMKYESSDRSLIWETSGNIKSHEKILDDEIADYKDRWAQAVIEMEEVEND